MIHTIIAIIKLSSFVKIKIKALARKVVVRRWLKMI